MYQCHYLHCAQSLLWWHVHVPSVPVSLFTPCTESVVVTCTCVPVSLFTLCTESVVVTCTQCTCVLVSLFTLCTESVVVTCTNVPVSLFTPCIGSVVVTCTQCTSVPVSLFTPCTESVVVTCTQCTSVTIYTVHRVCCGVMYPVYQCHYLHWSQSLLWWHVPSVPVSLFTPCPESVVVTCTQCTSVTIYTVHRVCCGDMYPVYQCHYLHRA